jgi:2,4-dienoyl-CoA reductase-like NADH-dependent reductase (Old Yellow Enzyme family)
MTTLHILFQPGMIGPLDVPNRLVAQPMEGGDADHGGSVSARGLARYQRLAEGGWGLVFVEATSVTPTSLGRPAGLVLSERTAASYEPLIGAFHSRNPQGLLLIQLTHSGRQSHPSTDRTSVCPDPPAGMRYLATAEVEAVRQQFVRTALLAEALGFDGVDIKLCNGYLGHEILRPANTRPDRWGGSWENRTRLVTEVYAEIRAHRRSPRFLLGSRLSFSERVAGGLGTCGPGSTAFDPHEPLDLVRLLAHAGASFVNITGEVTGVAAYADLRPEELLHSSLLAERLVRELVRDEKLGLAVIGSSYSALRRSAPPVAATRLAEGCAEWIGFGRQTFADPLFAAKLRAGQEVRWCTACGACEGLLRHYRPMGCARYEPYYRDLFSALPARERPG